MISRIIASSKVIPLIVEGNPATYQLTVCYIIGFAINSLKAGAGKFIAAIANELAVLNVYFIGMTGGLYNSTPINN